MKAPNGRTEITARFGNPAKANGQLNEGWEAQNIRRVPPPGGWNFFYQDDKGPVKVSGIRIHRLLADNFVLVLDDIWNHAKAEVGSGATDEQIRKWLHDRKLDLHGGGFNFRPITGGSGLSLHSYGIAIDWDPLRNPRKKPLTFKLPEWWYDIWHKHGWIDGRKFKTPDPMHVQFATGA